MGMPASEAVDPGYGEAVHLPIRIVRVWDGVRHDLEADAAGLAAKGLENVDVSVLREVAHQHPIEIHRGDARQMTGPATGMARQGGVELVNPRAEAGGSRRRPFGPLRQASDADSPPFNLHVRADVREIAPGQGGLPLTCVVKESPLRRAHPRRARPA